MDTAWNWLINAQIGQEIFQQKIGYVVQTVQNAVAKYPTLAPLTQLQLEHMAVLQFGGWVGGGNVTNFNAQYYTPQTYNGSLQWRSNGRISRLAQYYVSHVFSPSPKTPFSDVNHVSIKETLIMHKSILIMYKSILIVGLFILSLLPSTSAQATVLGLAARNWSVNTRSSLINSV